MTERRALKTPLAQIIGVFVAPKIPYPVLVINSLDLLNSQFRVLEALKTLYVVLAFST